MKLTAIKFILLFLAQVAVWNYFNFTPYLFVVFLPALILCLPLGYGTVRTMLIAFVAGLAADFLVSGQLGMTSFALVPVALMRQSVVRLAFGSELFARGEDLSFHRQGWQKFLLCTAILTAIYLLVHIWVDSAGMYSLGFCAIKFGISLPVSSALSMAIAYLMLEQTGERWR
jgi:hypothetical protein